MSRSRLIVFAGAIVALLPILGFPRAWEAVFQTFVGLSIIGLSIWSTIDKKLSLKARARERAFRRRAQDLQAETTLEQVDTPPYSGI